MLRLDYDEISPITGEKTVLVEYDSLLNDTIKLCMKTGYQTYLNTWKADSPELMNYEMQLPSETVITKFVDSNKNVWYRITMQSPHVLLYCENNTWKVVTLEIAPIGDAKVIPIQVPISETETALRFLNEDNAEKFNAEEFEDALFTFQSRITEIRKKNDN